MVAQLFHRAPQRARTATPLLAFIAGDFADAIAQLWPAPHGEFFALPAARRHAAAIALAGLARQPISGRRPPPPGRIPARRRRGGGLAGDLAHRPDARPVQSGRNPVAARALRDLRQLMAEPMANEVLRHLDDVRPDAFAPIAALPPALRMATIVRVLPSAGGGGRSRARLPSGGAHARAGCACARIARRWGAGGDTRARVRARLRRPDARRLPHCRSCAGAGCAVRSHHEPQAAGGRRARIPQLPRRSRRAHRGRPHGRLCLARRTARCDRAQPGRCRLAAGRSESAGQRRSRRGFLRELVSASSARRPHRPFGAVR